MIEYKQRATMIGYKQRQTNRTASDEEGSNSLPQGRTRFGGTWMGGIESSFWQKQRHRRSRNEIKTYMHL